jgi:hypothetical protein
VVVDWKQNGAWTPDLYLTQLEDMLTRAHAALKDRICNLVGHAHTSRADLSPMYYQIRFRRPSAHHEPIFLLYVIRLDLLDPSSDSWRVGYWMSDPQAHVQPSCPTPLVDMAAIVR